LAALQSALQSSRLRLVTEDDVDASAAEPPPVAAGLPEHPVRRALLELFAETGTLTATQAAARLGYSSGLCSFHLRQLARYGLKALESVDGLVLYGPKEPERRGATFSFNVFDSSGELLPPHDMATLLDGEGVAIRASHHCAKPLMRHYDVAATCRAPVRVPVSLPLCHVNLRASPCHCPWLGLHRR
jgi:selenocysteine lyase/cysteine desulfurase